MQLVCQSCSWILTSTQRSAIRLTEKEDTGKKQINYYSFKLHNRDLKKLGKNGNNMVEHLDDTSTLHCNQSFAYSLNERNSAVALTYFSFEKQIVNSVKLLSYNDSITILFEKRIPRLCHICHHKRFKGTKNTQFSIRLYFYRTESISWSPVVCFSLWLWLFTRRTNSREWNELYTRTGFPAASHRRN